MQAIGRRTMSPTDEQVRWQQEEEGWSRIIDESDLINHATKPIVTWFRSHYS
jgi:hypothetical protein